MKLKVCGMKYVENIQQVAALQPDYLGFIFYDKSKRNFDGMIPELPKSIKKTGVFVNAKIDEVVSKIKQYNLQAVQLHGDESVNYINELKCLFERSRELEIIKVFGIKDKFDFDVLKPYLEVVDYFLFDTKGKERGGNGITFDWKVLEKYPFTKPFFLSGGIGLGEVKVLQSFLRKQESKYCYALDINSQFEIKAGLKSVDNIEKFKNEIKISTH
ncbi:phosphoribosylanthranilate isomerase [Polaribacter huanghezhanensis]|uniref:phosphoribosylanthranilate isomerase n=1 Tax=Polaribacter huanghezhanensis TaxID=1354726 RepID=UPI0026478942|nr:phosphoribosylanthranilate isomerase [Polaribacter huanghezhanensis]